MTQNFPPEGPRTGSWFSRAARSRWFPFLSAFTAGILVIGLVGGVFWLVGRDGGTQPPAGSAPTATQPTAGPVEPTGPAEPTTAVPTTPTAPTAPTTPTTPTVKPTPPKARTITVPVYYLADYGHELRLYREFHRVTTRLGPVQAALEQMLRARPDDPDYRSLWPKDSRVLSYGKSGDLATVNLSIEAARNAGSGSEGEARSVQQLVYTVTAADPSVHRVRLLIAGRQVDDLWGHGAVGTQPLTRSPRLDVQGLIWVLAPDQGGTVSSPVTLRVYGTAFEGHVVLKVFRDGTTVLTTFATTAMGEFREGSARVRLARGDYTVRAYDVDMRDGALIERDSKAFRVR